MRRRKLIAMALSLMLVTGMIMTAVAPVYAASTKTIYVVTAVKQNGEKMQTYTYDSKGRLKKASLNHGSTKCEFKYDSKGRLTKFRKAFNDWCNFDYKYDSKGRIKTVDNYYTSTSNGKRLYDGITSKFTYNSKGQVTKEVAKDGKKSYTNKYKYNGKGLLSQATIKYPTRKGTYKYTYDKKKNISNVRLDGSDWKGNWIYENKYNSAGRLTKRVMTEVTDDGEEYSLTYTYTYKKMKVSSKYASAVKAQQWLLINEGLHGPTEVNINFAIPRNDYGGM